MTTGLIRREGRYSTRRVIPLDLQRHYGRREVVRALGTATPGEARALHARMWVALDDEFSAARATLRGDEAEAPAARTLETKPHLGSRKNGGTTLTALMTLWLRHQERPPATIAAVKRAVSLFEEHGGRTLVEQITRRDVAAFIDKVRLPECAGGANMSIPTLNSNLSLLSALFGYAVRRCLIETNPAAKTQIADSRTAREKRREFDSAALVGIFSSPIYAKGDRPKGGAGEAAYWLPLLALYTGARVSELCQLRPCDVVEEGYVDPMGESQKAWVIRIEENKAVGQRVKTDGSERRIPIHADLIDLGFLTYAHGQQFKALLFDKLNPGHYGRLSGAWGQWFSEYLRTKCGVTDPRMTFHSFRHTFKNCARQCLIPPDVHNALTGHETGQIADAYG